MRRHKTRIYKIKVVGYHRLDTSDIGGQKFRRDTAMTFRENLYLTWRMSFITKLFAGECKQL